MDWAADASLDGTGTGTLQGGAITVTYSTVSGAGNAGTTLPNVGWDTSLATDAVGPVNHLSAGVFGQTQGASIQSISFSADVTNPILFMNFSDETSVMGFNAIFPLTLTFLDSNNAQLSGGNSLAFTGSTNTVNDGFAAVVNGTFGPSTTPIVFGYATSAPFDSVAFTVGVTTVPEPSSLFLTAGSIPLLTRRLRRS